MTRNLTLTGLVLILLAGTLSAEQRRSQATDADPVASLTARILSQFFPDSSASPSPIAQTDDDAEDASADTGDEPLAKRFETLPFWSGPMQIDLAKPALSKPVELMPLRPIPLPPGNGARSALALMSRQMAAVKAPVEGAPLALSAASANGNYAIEAIVPTDDGPQKVKLNGTRQEVEDQLRALPDPIRRSLGRSLGM